MTQLGENQYQRWLCRALLTGFCGALLGVLCSCGRTADSVLEPASASAPADSGNSTVAEEQQGGNSVSVAAKNSDSNAPRPIVDPAPPQVQVLAKQSVPTPKPYARVKIHGAPKPLPPGAKTQDWTDFLGPTHNSVSGETHLLKKFPPGGPKLLWELETGDGYASPSIQTDRLLYPYRVGDEVVVECLHPETGKLHWQFKFPSTYRDRYQYSDGPRASPVIDGDRVYVYSAEGKLFCLDLSTGRVVWQRHVNDEFHVPQDFFGTATNPLLVGNLLIINVGAPQGPCVIALDKLSGKLVWGAGDKWGPSYASPVPAMIHGQLRVFVFAGGDSQPPTGGLLSIDPRNGAIDFEFPWRSRTYESVNAACPVVVGNQVFVTASYRTGSALLDIQPDFSFQKVWTTIDREYNTGDNELGFHWNTAVYKDGHLYGFDGRNEPDASMVCVNLKTGKVVWRKNPTWEETITVQGEKFQDPNVSTLRGSMLLVDGHGLCLGELGHLLWLDLTPDGYRELDRAWLFNSIHTWSPPVVSHGLLYVCQNSSLGFTSRGFFRHGHPRLLCYDLRAEP